MNLKKIENTITLILVLLGVIYVPSMIIKAVIIIFGVIGFVIINITLNKEKQKSEEKDNINKVMKAEIERLRLNIKGIPQIYTDGLLESPLFQYAFKVGEEYERKGKCKEAIRSYQEILNNPLADEESRVAAYNLIGISHFELFEFEKAMENFQIALSIVEMVKVKEEMLKGKAATLTNIGLIYQELGQWEDTLKKYKSALRLYHKLDDTWGKASSLYNIHLIYLYLNKPKKALGKIKEAIQAFQEALKVYTPEDFPMDYAKTQSNLGNAYRTLAEIKDRAVNCNKAIQAFQEALKVYTKEGFPEVYRIIEENIKKVYEL